MGVIHDSGIYRYDGAEPADRFRGAVRGRALARAGAERDARLQGQGARLRLHRLHAAPRHPEAPVRGGLVLAVEQEREARRRNTTPSSTTPKKVATLIQVDWKWYNDAQGRHRCARGADSERVIRRPVIPAGGGASRPPPSAALAGEDGFARVAPPLPFRPRRPSAKDARPFAAASECDSWLKRSRLRSCRASPGSSLASPRRPGRAS